VSDKSKIKWTDATWNPLRGCTKISQGCRHCYAETFAERWRGIPGHPFEQGFDLRLVPEGLDIPLRWKRARRIFVNSMSDLFHKDVPDEYIAAVFGIMAVARQHTFQVLTKRAERLPAWFAWLERYAASVVPEVQGYGREKRIVAACMVAAQKYCEKDMTEALHRLHVSSERWTWPLRNVHLGVSVENPDVGDDRISYLLKTPAAVRFISAEPLLAALNVDHYLSEPESYCWNCGVPFSKRADQTWEDLRNDLERCVRCKMDVTGRHALDWVIVGGESGHGARPCSVNWIQSLVKQCSDNDVPVFVKQLGANVCMELEPDEDAPWEGKDDPPPPRMERVQEDDPYRWRVRLKHRKGEDMAEWPKSLQVQQFPKEAA